MGIIQERDEGWENVMGGGGDGRVCEWDDGMI